MAISSLPHLSLFSIFLLTLTSIKSLAQCQCLDEEKALLLELRSELIFNSSHSVKLVMWNESNDCCNWHGVECNGRGHVIGLQLNDEGISGGIDESSSLFHLRYLHKLNMAHNDINFITTPIPRGIAHLSYLTHLNLSDAGLGGNVPVELSFLRRLLILDLSSDMGFGFQIDHHLKVLIQNLTSLRELYLDGIDISVDGSEWSQAIASSLPNLQVLSLRGCSLSGPFHPSLTQLPSLSVLRLDRNKFSTTIPDYFANFSSLRSLSLNQCDLRGSIPNKMLQVPTLEELDLSNNELLGGTIPQFPLSKAFRSIDLSHCSFEGPIPFALGNLTNLVHLDLSYNSLTGSIPSFYMSSKLTTIRLCHNNLVGSLSERHFEGLSNLVELYLYENSLSGSIPHTLFGLPSLVDLRLFSNQFSGQVEEFPIYNLTNIFYISLSYNKLGGRIPRSFFSLPSLVSLYLSFNQFSGQVHEFPIVNDSNLDTIDLSGNRLEGPIPDSLFQFQHLEYLLLSDNLFNGTFKLEKIQRFPNLKSLYLSDNNLSVDVTNISSSSHGFPKLEVLWLASCNLVRFPDFVKQSSLGTLDLSNNRIAGDIPSWVWGIGNGTLSILNLSCNIMFEALQKPYHFPTSLGFLDLHSNQLQGQLPPLPQNAFYVDYSHNYFDSPIPSTFFTNVFPSMWFLSLANNDLTGTISTSLCNATMLFFINLSFNKLSGVIPPCLVETKTLQVLSLRGNQIHGLIPDQFPVNCDLRTLDLSSNNLGGKIPKSLANCKSLAVFNVGHNKLNDSFPCMLSSSLRVIVLRSNRFHGDMRCEKSWSSLQILDLSSNDFGGTLLPLNLSSWRGMILEGGGHLRLNHSISGYLNFSTFYQDKVTLTLKGIEVELVKIWPDFTSIDMSCNNFHGDIPDAIGDLTSLYVLNLSHNALTNTIPRSVGALRDLGSLDLSWNQLTGRIPEELARLTFLSVLNLSYNQLVGPIPIGPQFQTYSADSLEGNAGLCGEPLNTSCGGTVDGNDSRTVQEEEIEWEYVCGAVGYVVGLGSIVWTLVFCRGLRQRYFEKIEDIVEMRYRRRRETRRRMMRRRRGVGD